ncbi:hypothetical protein LCGC14_2859350, partial [marine sediment metagenome]
RNAGVRFGELFKPGGDGSNQHGDKRAIHTGVRLADYGINNRIADICRKIAILPDDLFSDLILEIRTTEHITHQEITTSFFYKAAKIHLMRMRGISTDRPQAEEPEAEIDLEFAAHMFWAGAVWEGRINTSGHNNPDEEVRIAIEEWRRA